MLQVNLRPGVCNSLPEKLNISALPAQQPPRWVHQRVVEPQQDSHPVSWLSKEKYQALLLSRLGPSAVFRQEGKMGLCSPFSMQFQCKIIEPTKSAMQQLRKSHLCKSIQLATASLIARFDCPKCCNLIY